MASGGIMAVRLEAVTVICHRPGLISSDSAWARAKGASRRKGARKMDWRFIFGFPGRFLCGEAYWGVCVGAMGGADRTGEWGNCVRFEGRKVHVASLVHLTSLIKFR